MQSKPLKSEVRPWGRYDDYYRDDKVVFKIIYVAPKQRLSLQSHEGRSEVWVHVSGEGYALIDGKKFELCFGNRVVVEVGQTHRLVNTGSKDLVVAEMQHGVCSEDDILRFSDDYGRDKKQK
jgi:mannose-6-phosphate isomerase-like protein (cupin superfamily)